VKSNPRDAQDHAKLLNPFMRKLVSSVLLLIGIAIALGGFGHSLGAGGRRVEAALVAHAVPDEISKLVLVVWHFAGGGMVVLGILVIRHWLQVRKGARAPAFVPLLIAIFYLCFGGCALAYSKGPFFAVFIVLGGLLLACTLLLKRGAEKIVTTQEGFRDTR
jgi:amino acid transporter